MSANPNTEITTEVDCQKKPPAINSYRPEFRETISRSAVIGGNCQSGIHEVTQHEESHDGAKIVPKLREGTNKGLFDCAIETNCHHESTSNAEIKPPVSNDISNEEETAAYKKRYQIIHYPRIRFGDIAQDLDKHMKDLTTFVVLPMKFPQVYEGTLSPRVLIYGRSRVDTNRLGRAVLNELEIGRIKVTIFSFSALDIYSMWLGESESRIGEVFEMARDHKPSVLFIEGIDEIINTPRQGQNRRLTVKLILELDGTFKKNEGLAVIASAQSLETMDQRLRNRFYQIIDMDDAECSSPAAKYVFADNCANSDSIETIEVTALSEYDHLPRNQNIAKPAKYSWWEELFCGLFHFVS